MMRLIVQEKLIFVISPPRSGSTLLQRMLGSHTEIATSPEPHLITPMAYLGYYNIVDKAPYDHINSAEAIRLFVKDLPRGEEDYLDALRSYAETLYGRKLATTGKSRFMDKTPAYGLVLPFLQKLFPKAKYVVLTRHPLAIMSSYANSFFEGDWKRAQQFNPIINRYLPAMAKFIRESETPLIHVRYEDMVSAPEAELGKIFSFLGLENQKQAANYGEHFQATSGPGDPITVGRHTRPITTSIDKWASELSQDAAKLELAHTIIDALDPKDLQTWGNPKDSIFAALDSAHAQKSSLSIRPKFFNKHTMQRRIFLKLRQQIQRKPLNKTVRKIRYYCDVLLRE
ncbi:MAG: sulfotransferase [Myxococcales bacterium]|nr:MAG: sulfotransferase [Myxococcales bacterium]